MIRKKDDKLPAFHSELFLELFLVRETRAQILYVMFVSSTFVVNYAAFFGFLKNILQCHLVGNPIILSGGLQFANWNKDCG